MDYQKDGQWGGMTARQLIQLALYELDRANDPNRRIQLCRLSLRQGKFAAKLGKLKMLYPSEEQATPDDATGDRQQAHETS